MLSHCASTTLLIVAPVALSATAQAVEPDSVYYGEKDILLASRAWGGPCDDVSGINNDCSGVHASAIEVVAYDDGSTYGDVYAITYWDINHGITYAGYDTRRGLLASGQIYSGLMAASLNPAGHTTSCSWGGTSSPYGCGWLVGWRMTGGVPKVILIQARSLRPTNPPAGIAWNNTIDWAVGKEPAGDAGRKCVKWNQYYQCIAWSSKLLVVYASADRTQLLGQFVGLDAAKIGSEFNIASGSQIRAPQVAWQASQSRWVIVFERRIGVPGGTAGSMWSTTVSWTGPSYSASYIGECEVGCAQAGAAPLVNTDCQCHPMTLAASPSGQPDQFLLHEYQWDYLLGSNGQFLSWQGGQDMYWAVAPTKVPGYQFQRLQRLFSGGIYRVGHRLFPPDTTPPSDPWYDGRAPGDWYSLSDIEGGYGQVMRMGSTTAGAVFFQGSSVYLSVANNQAP